MTGCHSVHISSRVERQLADLMGPGNSHRATAPAIAAKRARTIIDGLILGKAPASCGLMRPRLDKRLKNSLKFNLGQGFRLICVKEKTIIYVVCVGDHDSTNTWLTHHIRKKFRRTGRDMVVFEVGRACDVPGVHIPTTDLSVPKEPPLDDPCRMEIPQKYLRRVFKGLAAG